MLRYFPRCENSLEAMTEARKLLASPSFLGQFSDCLREFMVRKLLWVLTEGPCPTGSGSTRRHKYEEVPFRTPAAQAGGNRRHEHVFDLKWAVAELLAHPDRCHEIADQIVACVVTEEEHQQLKAHGRGLVGWERYKSAGLTVLDVRKDPSDPAYWKVPAPSSS